MTKSYSPGHTTFIRTNPSHRYKALSSSYSPNLRSSILSNYGSPDTTSTLSNYTSPITSTDTTPNNTPTTTPNMTPRSEQPPSPYGSYGSPVGFPSSLPDDARQNNPWNTSSAPTLVRSSTDSSLPKKDYKVVGVIKDQVVDDLVQVSRNFLPVIKGGTLDKLIERLTFESSTEWDNDYVDVFLLTYKSFISSKELLNRLFDRFRSGLAEIDQSLNENEFKSAENKQKIIRIRVTNVLKRWLQDHFHEFSNDQSLLDDLRNGIQSVLDNDKASFWEKIIKEQIEKKDKITKKELMFSEKPPASVIPRGNTFDDFSTLEMARQICLYQQSIFQSIHPQEALNQNWNKRKERAPNIIRMINFFNIFSRWVATYILSKDVLKDRVKAVKRILKILAHLREFNNFDALTAVLAGLNNSSVYRLKATWEKIKKYKVYNSLVECREIMDTTGSYSNYRKAVSTADPPIVPYLGVYLTDLTFIEDGNSDYLKVKCDRDNIINFDKLRKVAAVIKDIDIYKQTPYNFNSVDAIQNFLANLKPLDDDELYKISRTVEPPGTIAQKKKEGFIRKASGSFSALFSKEKGDKDKN